MFQRQIYFNWKNVEYTVGHNFDAVGYVKLPTGEILGIGNTFWQIKTEKPQLQIPVCLILFEPKNIIKINDSYILVANASPYLSNLLEVSQGLDNIAMAHPYLDRYVCQKCNEINLNFISCLKCGSEIKHEVTLEWPDTPPITTKYGIHVVTSQATCPNCQTSLDLDKQPSVCPTCSVKLQWHISPSTPHMAY